MMRPRRGLGLAARYLTAVCCNAWSRIAAHRRQAREGTILWRRLPRQSGSPPSSLPPVQSVLLPSLSLFPLHFPPPSLCHFVTRPHSRVIPPSHSGERGDKISAHMISPNEVGFKLSTSRSSRVLLTKCHCIAIQRPPPTKSNLANSLVSVLEYQEKTLRTLNEKDGTPASSCSTCVTRRRTLPRSFGILEVEEARSEWLGSQVATSAWTSSRTMVLAIER